MLRALGLDPGLPDALSVIASRLAQRHESRLAELLRPEVADRPRG